MKYVAAYNLEITVGSIQEFSTQWLTLHIKLLIHQLSYCTTIDFIYHQVT